MDAEAKAIELGGHLVAIDNLAEQDWILDTFNPSRNKNTWIGLSDTAVEGTFVWSNGQPVTFTYWGINEPNNSGGNEDYAYIDAPHGTDRWNDLVDKTEHSAPGGGFLPMHGVVEIVGAPVPEPSTYALAALGLLGLLAYRRRR